MNTRTFDIIGDIHGELPALRALGRELGYDVDGGWSHPERRFLIFLGDLVDRGAYSLEVADLVHDLVSRRRAVCIMGNHEYNLVAHHLKVPGYLKPKRSNAPTIRSIEADPGRWKPVLDFFRTLPIALNLPDLRLIHACWNKDSLAKTEPILRGSPGDDADDTLGWLLNHVALRSPFGETGLLPGLPGDTSDKDADVPHEVLMKGFEVDAPEPFKDNDGKLRTYIRAVWWKDGRELVLTDKPQVFGHYWNAPPLKGHFAPPHPSGHPALRAWGEEMLRLCPPKGRLPLTGDVACVDFHGITRASSGLACIGALRWPERQIVWATGEKTATNGSDD
jgi:hypothetical protein